MPAAESLRPAGGTFVQVSSSLGSLGKLSASYRQHIKQALDLPALAGIPFQASDRDMRNQMVPTCESWRQAPVPNP